MYCCYSRLRKPDMTLKDIVEMLEVSQDDIAKELGISKSAVNQYINDYCQNQEKLDAIYLYLNSREYYNGYSFLPTKEFSKFLFDQVLCYFEDTMKQNEIAHRLRISPQKLAKLKNCRFAKGKTQKLDVYEQYYILSAAYDMCEEKDGYVPEKYIPLRCLLREVMEPYTLRFLSTEFSSLLIDAANAGYGDLLRSILRCYGIEKISDYNRALHDDEFIMDMIARREIVKRLYDGIASEKDMPKKLLQAKEVIYEEGDYALLDTVCMIDHTPLYRCSVMLRRVIMDNFYAFFDGTPDQAAIKKDIAEKYLKLSQKDKEAVCKETADRLLKYAQTANADNFPLQYEINKKGKLEYSSEKTLCFRELSDISDVIQIVNRTGPLDKLNEKTAHLTYHDKQPFGNNRDDLLDVISDSDEKYFWWEDVIEIKLQFDSLDWNFWGLMTQTLYMGRSLEDIFEYVSSVKGSKKSEKTKEGKIR